jgi:hypothetical protein
MPESTSKRDGRESKDPLRANEPPAARRSDPEPDRDVENYRDEYDVQERARRRADHRSYP